MTEKRRILVIDDDRTTQDLFVAISEKIQFDIDVAPSGTDAMQQIRSQPYDLIFLDLNMPQMSGIEVLEALREQGVTTPVYIITGFFEEYMDALQKLADAGIVFELLRKPLRVGVIVDVIQGVLDCQ